MHILTESERRVEVDLALEYAREIALACERARAEGGVRVTTDVDDVLEAAGVLMPEGAGVDGLERRVRLLVQRAVTLARGDFALRVHVYATCLGLRGGVVRSMAEAYLAAMDGVGLELEGIAIRERIAVRDVVGRFL